MKATEGGGGVGSERGGPPVFLRCMALLSSEADLTGEKERKRQQEMEEEEEEEAGGAQGGKRLQARPGRTRVGWRLAGSSR